MRGARPMRGRKCVPAAGLDARDGGIRYQRILAAAGLLSSVVSVTSGYASTRWRWADRGGHRAFAR